MSRIGLLLCSLYVVPSLGCIAYALSSNGDTKANFVYLQLPVALQGAFLSSLGFGSLLAQLSWPAAYALLALPIVAVLYALGALVGKLAAQSQHVAR